MNPAWVEQVRSRIAALRLALANDDEDEALRADMLEGETDLHEVLRSLVKEVRSSDYGRQACKEAAKTFTDRAARLDARSDRLRDAIGELMEIAGLPKIDLGIASVSVREGPKSVVVDEAKLPDQFWRETTKREPNKIALKQALENGEAIDGAVLSNGGRTVTIRI